MKTCKRCNGTRIEQTTVDCGTMRITATGACLECQMQERLQTKGTTDFIAVRYRLMEQPITLDGKPARIAGAKCDEAHVWCPPDLRGVPFAWETVRHVVMNRGGAFRS